MYCIVGADGFLGSEFMKYVLDNSDEFILALNHEKGLYPDGNRVKNMIFEMSDEKHACDFADELKKYTDIKILHLACVHNPDAIKANPELAGYINTVCYERYLNKLEGIEIKQFIYASSDTVYGENRYGRPFVETDDTKPVNIYGSQKKAAEQITHAHGYSVVRLPYMSGESKTPRKKHFFDQLEDELLAGKEIMMLTDYVRSCLSYTQAAELIFKVFESETEEKTINICADIPTDKYTIGLMIAEYCGVSPELVKAVTSKELGIFEEYRANILTMDNSLMKKVTGIQKVIELDYRRGENNG